MDILEENHPMDPKNNMTDDYKDDQGKRITVCLLSAAFFGALGSSFLYGYNLSVVNAATLFVKEFYNTTWVLRYGEEIGGETTTLLWSMTVSTFAIGGFLGAVIVTVLVKVYGRKGTLLRNNGFALIAALMLVFGERAGSFEMLILGRILAGVNSGIGLNAVSMYLAEISPRYIRGSICQMNAILINIGLLLGQILGLPELLGQESRWNFLFGFVALPALLQLSVLPFLPESPRYLLMEKRDEAGAEEAFRRFLGKKDVSQELEEVYAESRGQNNLQVISVLELLRNPAVRWQIITVIITMGCYQLCGFNALFYYTDGILDDAGIEDDLIPYITLSTGGLEVIVSIFTGLMIERVGRRPLLISSFVGMAASFSLLTLFLNNHGRASWMPYLSYGCILAGIAFFSVGPAGTSFILTSELFEQSYRPAAFMIGGSVCWLSNFAVGQLFPFLQQALHPFVFLVFVLVCLMCAVYLYAVLPETKNKTFMDISRRFAKRNKVCLPTPDRGYIPIQSFHSNTGSGTW